MLNSNFYSKKLAIHVDFPKDLLLEIFKPFLYYYFIVNYDIQGTHRTSVFKRILYIKLKKFYKYNTTFGRKILHSKPKLFNNFNLTKKWQPFSFITHHISFHNIKVYDTDTDFVETADIISNTNINTNILGNNYINNDSTIADDEEEEEDEEDDAEEDEDDENNTLEHGYNTTESDTIEDDEIDDISLS
jgi:hypothetical protein